MILFSIAPLLVLLHTCDCTVTNSRGLHPGTKTLDNMIVDDVSGYVYIAATNTLYVMDNNLNTITQVSLGPHNDSLNCPPNPVDPCDCPYSGSDNINITVDADQGCQKYNRKLTDAVVKNLVINPKNQELIVCSNLYYGYCSKLSLKDYTIISSYLPIVSNSLDGESIAFIAPSGHLNSALYFGVSRDINSGLTMYKDRTHMLSVRNMDNFDIAHRTTDSASFLDIKRDLRDEFPINFKFGFSYQDNSYFLITRRDSLKNNDTASYIFRVCQNDQKLHSYIEIKMECISGNTDFNSAITAYVSKIGSDLADELQISREDDVLFAIFSTSLPASFMVSDHSTGICMYSLKDIESAFYDSTNFCFSGFGKTGPEHIVQPEACQTETIDLCGGSENNWPLLGKHPAKPVAHYSFVGSMLTSIAVKRTGGNKYTVGYLGTNKGNIRKVSFESKTSSPDFGVEHLSEDGKAISKHMVFDATEKNIYAITEQQVMKILLVNCSQHSSCDQCLKAQDPHCGWCSLQNQCTEKSDCELGNTQYDWLHYQFLVCPAVTQVLPDKIPINDVTGKQLILKLNALPEDIAVLSLTCELFYENLSITSIANTFVGGVNCTPFNVAPRLPDNSSIAEIEADLWIQVKDKRWVNSQIKLFDCHRIKTCSECAGGDLPCIWCMKSNTCMNDRSVCSSGAVLSSYTSSEIQRYSSADLVGSEHCPRIESKKEKDLLPSGNQKELMLKAAAVQDYHKENLRCRFDYGIVVNATFQEFSRSIICEKTTLGYPGKQGYRDIPVQVLWDTEKLLDNPQHASVRVYKCEYLASDCGTCTFLDPAYECGWCDNKCSLSENCEGDFLGRDNVCPGPQITKITPAIGPYRGGTNLTIEGINLGKKIEDVRDNVVVAGIKCTVTPELYKPPSSLVCVTAHIVEERTGEVKITIAGMQEHEAVSEQKYRYQDPVLPVYNPLKGPVSGGTHVTISGQYLDMGSQVTVSINGKTCPVVKRNNNLLEFITSPQPAPINGKVKIDFDGTMISEFPTKFAFIADPHVTEIHPQSVLQSGGSVVVITGSNLDSSTQPKFFVQKDGVKAYSVCQKESKKSLNCPLPDLSSIPLENRVKRSTDTEEKQMAQLSYGLEIDGWQKDLADLSYDLDLNFHPIEVYPDPEVYGFTDENSVKPYTGDGMTFEIQGANLDIFNIVPGLVVIVGNTSCEIQDITAERILAKAPAAPILIEKNGNSQVTVSLGNFKVDTGYIQYASGSSGNTGVVLGVLFGVIIPVLLILIVLYLLRRNKNKKKGGSVPVSRDNGVAEKGNIYTPPAEKEVAEASAMLPLKEMTQNDVAPIKPPVGSDGEEEEEVASDKPFQLSDFLERIRDPKLRANVQEVIITHDRLEMKDMIGRGNFGCVYMADLRADHDDNACRVAVKTLQGERLEQHTVEAFLKEGVIMKNFNHPHVLKLLGVCIDHQENPMVILPYMANGDLRTYVKDKKKNFTARQLLHLAQQVAEGMAYLSSLNFVHRDLAARNCMIDGLDTVKVADFGLTRDLFEKQYFSTNLKEKRGKMPIKWMALESLEEFVFTTKSDVWSFGVLMWELMTRGVTPYPDVDIFDVRNYLASGRRLRKPKYCPENIYNIMLECWHADPDIRPSFTDLVNRIELLLNPPKRRVNREESTGEPMYVNIRKANSTEYLKPVDGTFVEAPHENSNGSPVV